MEKEHYTGIVFPTELIGGPPHLDRRYRNVTSDRTAFDRWRISSILAALAILTYLLRLIGAPAQRHMKAKVEFDKMRHFVEKAGQFAAINSQHSHEVTMRLSLRKFALTTHITLSVGWIGAVVAYLILVVAAITSQDAQTLRAAWIAMELIGWYVIVPLALTSLLTGIVMALGTPWGLFRHYWVVISLVLTIVATVVLLQHMPTVSFFAGVAAETERADVGRLRGGLWGELIHAGVGLLVLLVIEVLNVYKPQGMTAYGRRKVSKATLPSRSSDDVRWATGFNSRAPRWAWVVGIHAIGLALLLVVMHLTGGGLLSH